MKKNRDVLFFYTFNIGDKKIGLIMIILSKNSENDDIIDV